MEEHEGCPAEVRVLLDFEADPLEVTALGSSFRFELLQ